VNYTKNDEGKFVCECGNFIGSRSGFYKHKAVKHSPPKEDIKNEPVEVESVEVDEDDSTEENTSWMDWGDNTSNDDSTDTMPSAIKSLQKKATTGKRSKRTKAEVETLRATSKSLVTLGLTFGDSALSVWGRGVLLDPDFMVKHDDKTKEITSDAVVGAMEEKGLYIADSISRTAIASLMVGWYFGAPAYRIQKKAKRGLFKGGRGSGLLSRIPLIGRLFRKKNVQIIEEVKPDVE